MVDIAIEKLGFKYDTSASAATTNIRQQNPSTTKGSIFISMIFYGIIYWISYSASYSLF